MNKNLKQTCIFIFSPLLVFASLLSTANQTAFAEGKKLSSDAEKVIDYLSKDWRKQFGSTDIATAIENLGMKQDDELRLQIGDHFRENLDLVSNLRISGLNNYLLSNTEKLIANYMIHKIENESGYPTLEEAVKVLEIDKKTLKERMAFMKKAGILVSAENSLKYSLIFNYKTWGGPLRYNYHTVTIEGEQPFGVW